MPIYTYECTTENCKNIFDVDQSIKDEPLKICEKCGGDLQKIISGTSFILKGTGWYETDYKKKS